MGVNRRFTAQTPKLLPSYYVGSRGRIGRSFWPDPDRARLKVRILARVPKIFGRSGSVGRDRSGSPEFPKISEVSEEIQKRDSNSQTQCALTNEFDFLNIQYHFLLSGFWRPYWIYRHHSHCLSALYFSLDRRGRSLLALYYYSWYLSLFFVHINGLWYCFNFRHVNLEVPTIIKHHFITYQFYLGPSSS